MQQQNQPAFTLQDVINYQIVDDNLHVFIIACLWQRNFKMVGEVGLEPTRLIQPADFKSAAYTNSATRPGGAYGIRTRVQGFADPCLTTRPTRHKPPGTGLL